MFFGEGFYGFPTPSSPPPPHLPLSEVKCRKIGSQNLVVAWLVLFLVLTYHCCRKGYIFNSKIILPETVTF